MRSSTPAWVQQPACRGPHRADSAGKAALELNADSVDLGDCPADEYPLQKKKMSMEYLRTMPTLRPRTNTFNAAFRVRSVAAYAIHKFFQENGFVYAHSPLLTASDCEGAGEMFRVTTLDLDNVPKNEDGTVDYTKDFFEKPVNLTVSGQLEAEAASNGVRQGVHLLVPPPRGEELYHPPRRRVLDDRAGDGVLRFE